jgi:hypothetical protein
MAQVIRRVEEKRDAARAKKADKLASAGRADFRGFVNFKPNAEEKEGFKQWFSSSNRTLTDTEELLNDGWKISLAVDKAEGVYVASIARWDAGHPEAGIILNCRTADAVQGHLRVVFALVYVYEWRLSAHIAVPAGEDLF